MNKRNLSIAVQVVNKVNVKGMKEMDKYLDCARELGKMVEHKGSIIVAFGTTKKSVKETGDQWNVWERPDFSSTKIS